MVKKHFTPTSFALLKTLSKFLRDISTAASAQQSIIKLNLIPHPLEYDFLNSKYSKQYDVIRVISVCRLIKLKNLNNKFKDKT